MKGLSIKWRVTLWYALFMVIVTVAVLIFIYFSSLYRNESYIKQNVINAVTGSIDEIEEDHGKLDIDDDIEDFDGVSILIYDIAENLIYGRPPSKLGKVPLSHGNFNKIVNGDNTFCIYDQKILVEDYGEVWLRGVSHLDSASYLNNSILILAFYVLPFLVLIAIAGGYFMTKRAFLPVKMIIQSVEGISEGKDLTKRIGLEGVKDEIYELANTFDHMFARLQNSFEKEKQFNSDASHELRTPATVIMSQCEYALTENRTEEERIEALASIQNQAKRMSTLISRLLALSRMDNQQQKLQFEEVDLRELAEVVAEEMEIMAEERNIKIESILDPELLVSCDQTLMTRLLINLITNAIKYGKENGKIVIKIQKRDGKIYGSIKDDGIGIADQDKELIWERFYRVDTARVNNDESYGLGLSMVKWIIQAHGGDITVQSKLGEGSTFEFWF